MAENTHIPSLSMAGFAERFNRRWRRLFNRHDRRVDFIVCGAQKGGTSALNVYLGRHPGICMADRKEVHFFDDEKRFRGSGSPDYDAYHAFFHPRPCHHRIGEVTPIYMYWQEAPRRIWEYNPGMKLIAVLRNPVERAFSHWNMEFSRGADRLPFPEAIRREKQRCRSALPWQHRVFSYIDRGFYLEQLRRLERFFPEENLLVLKNEHLRHQPRQTMDTVCRFLELPSPAEVRTEDVFSLTYAAGMEAREKDCLRKIFEPEIKALERRLGWDCSDWLAD